MSRAIWAVVWVSLLLAVCTTRAEEATTVFARVSPSVALIGNAEGFGSGVVIDKKGLILTNYHVVLTALPLTVRLRETVGDQAVDKVYEHVKIVKVHRTLDLALCQIEQTHDSFPALPLSDATKPTSSRPRETRTT